MNTLHHTNPRKPMNSGALMRRDQEVRGHRRLKGKAVKIANRPHLPDSEGGGKRAHSRYAEFGTIGAKLSRPER